MAPVQPLSSPHPPSNLSEDEDNDQNEDDSQGVGEGQGEGENPMSKDLVFDLNSVINPILPFLQGILLDTQMLSTSGEDTTPTVTTGPMHVEIKDCEPTEDNWEDM